MSVLFDLKGVSVRMGRGAQAVQALARVSLRLNTGERLALIGSNGSGKSSLLRLLHGLIEPDEGDMMRPADAAQAMLFQQPFLLRMSVQRNVALGLWLRGRAWGAAMQTALQALDRVGLSSLALRNARSLSGGERQRVALARAWALSPKVLLLDEPTASLDPRAKQEVEDLIHDFAEHDPNVSLVFASHNLGQVKRLASRVIYLEQGRVLADLPVADFFGGDLLQTHYPAAHHFVKG
jgi:tungstate transport system ATP-binding protein